MNLVVGGGRWGVSHKHQSRTYDEKNKAPRARGSHILVKVPDNEQVSHIPWVTEGTRSFLKKNKAKRGGRRAAGAEGRPREEATAEKRPVRTGAGEARSREGREFPWKPATLLLGHAIRDSMCVTDGRIEE